jgi:hypothetical protein
VAVDSGAGLNELLFTAGTDLANASIVGVGYFLLYLSDRGAAL